MTMAKYEVVLVKYPDAEYPDNLLTGGHPC